MALSPTTKVAIGLLGVPADPEDVAMYIREAIGMLPSSQEGDEEERWRLRLAFALCGSRMDDEHALQAELEMYDVAEETARSWPRIYMLARYYRAVLMFMRLAPAHDSFMQENTAVQLEKLATAFHDNATLAENNGYVSLCAASFSLAAECLVRANGDQVKANRLGVTSETAYLFVDHIGCPRSAARISANAAMRACGYAYPPPLEDLDALLVPTELMV